MFTIYINLRPNAEDGEFAKQIVPVKIVGSCLTLWSGGGGLASPRSRQDWYASFKEQHNYPLVNYNVSTYLYVYLFGLLSKILALSVIMWGLKWHSCIMQREENNLP